MTLCNWKDFVPACHDLVFSYFLIESLAIGFVNDDASSFFVQHEVRLITTQ